jgi:hypothetical protein
MWTAPFWQEHHWVLAVEVVRLAAVSLFSLGFSGGCRQDGDGVALH